MPLTEKENFMMVIRGETPEWVPRYAMFGVDPYATKPPACSSVMCSAIPFNFGDGKGYTDIFGVEYVATEETGWQFLPKPGRFILDDVRKWRDVVKLPDLTNIDWAEVAKKDMENSPINMADYAMMYGGVGAGGFFMPLMNMMGFTNGLLAMAEEPETVEEMFDFLAEWYCFGIKNTIDRYPVDIFSLVDDIAAMKSPFVSPSMYRKLIKPYAARTAKFAQDRGIPSMMHCCGRCEDFLEDWRGFGVNSWNPAQVYNDLDGIKKKYGNSMVLIGCWDSQGEAGKIEAPEDLVRQAVRDTIDRYGAGGGFMFWGSVYGSPDNPWTESKKKWITEEYEAYRSHPYK
jgi:hypothetical protein